MSVEEFDALAARLRVTRVELPDGGTYVPAFIDADARVLYLWQRVRMKWEEVPFRGPISGLRVVNLEDFKDYRVEQVLPPVRYVRNPDGTLAAGVFDPHNRVFYRWRGRPTTFPAGVGPAPQRLVREQDDPTQKRLTTVEVDPPAANP